MFGTHFILCHPFYDLPLLDDILSKGVHSLCHLLERRLTNPRVKWIIVHAITLYRDGMWRFTLRWHPQQSSTQFVSPAGTASCQSLSIVDCCTCHHTVHVWCVKIYLPVEIFFELWHSGNLSTFKSSEFKIRYQNQCSVKLQRLLSNVIWKYKLSLIWVNCKQRTSILLIS